MKRLTFILAILAAGCGKEPGPAAKTPPASAPVSKESPKESAEQILAGAEEGRSAAQYERAATAFTAEIESNPKNAAAHEGRALARWRLSLMRGVSDPEVGKDLEASGSRPRAKAQKALARLVDGARHYGWEPLGPRILKEVFAKAFPDSAAFTTDWVALARRPDGEIQIICGDLAGASDWPLAVGVRAALEGRDVPTPGNEGILWILTALRQAPGDAMKALESATGPDQGILFQAQAQLLAAESKFTEATGRMASAPLPVLRAAASIAAARHASALESLAAVDDTPYTRTLKAAALLQSGTEASMAELDKLLDQVPVAYLKFERGIRRLAAGNNDGALSDLKEAAPAGGAVSAAWLGFALWHLQDFAGAAKELEGAAKLKAEPDFALTVQETLAWATLAAGDEEKGTDLLLKAVESRPTREIFFKLAPHFRVNRQWKALRTLAETVARAVPTDPEPWAARAEASFWLKEYDAAIETVALAIKQKIDPKRLLRWRALAYEDQGKVAEAHDDWDRLTEVVDLEGEAFAHRGWMRAKQGRWAEAKEDAEQGVSRGAVGWAVAVARFALAAEALHAPPPEGETADPAERKEAALEHLRLAVKTGAVEPSDLKAEGPFARFAGTEEWKKLVESSAEKRKELKDEAKRGGTLGVLLDHGGGSVAVTGTVRNSGSRQAGLIPGDIILEVDGRRVIHVPNVSANLAGRAPGDKITVKIEREIRPKLKLVQVRTVTLTSRDLFGE